VLTYFCAPFLNSSTSHYDPTLACGGASDNALCSSKGGCVTDGTYTCDAAAFAANPWACEVGDMSGKHGAHALSAEGAGQWSSRTFNNYLPLPDVIQEMSIVFHCSGGRAFCAKFAPTTLPAPLLDPVADTGVSDSAAVAETAKLKSDITIVSIILSLALAAVTLAFVVAVVLAVLFFLKAKASEASHGATQVEMTALKSSSSSNSKREQQQRDAKIIGNFQV